MANPAEVVIDPAVHETPDKRASRLEHEARLIAEAEADYAAGRFIEGEELDRWLAWLVSDAPESEEPGRP